MFARLLFESFRRQLRRKAFALLAIALGMSITTAMIAVATDTGDKVNRELRSTNANLLLTPVANNLDVNLGGVDLKPASDRAYIPESDLSKLKDIFWGHNILAFAPFLSGSEDFWSSGTTSNKVNVIGTYFAQELHSHGATFVTGVRNMYKFWQVQGEWPKDDSSDVLVGVSLAQKAGIRVGDTLGAPRGDVPIVRSIIPAGPLPKVAGILTTGGPEDDSLIVPLHVAQQKFGRPGQVDKVLVSALTKPEDDFARRDPRSMPPAMYERWFCSPYANSIAFQIHEAMPDIQVEQIRQVEQNQGKILSRISGLMLLLTFAALIASALAVSAVMAATIMERRQEVGLMKSLGAGNGAVASLFLTEAGLLAVAGGFLGFVVGALVAHRIGQSVFGSAIAVHPVVLAIVVFAALTVAFAGSTGAVRKAMRFDPALVLRGDA